MLNLNIAQCGVTDFYAPVGDAGAFVNQALFKQSAENLTYSLGAASSMVKRLRSQSQETPDASAG